MTHELFWCFVFSHNSVTSVFVDDIAPQALKKTLHADDIVVMREGQVVHHGAGRDATTHAVIEDVFGQRIRIHALDGQWVVLPRVGGAITGID
jgi:ABC-type enterochelin transport system ATPase subunit